MTEGLLKGGHVVGHVRGVGELGGPVHEVVHGRPTGVPVGEVKVAMALVAVAWGGNEMGRDVTQREDGHPRKLSKTQCKGGSKAHPPARLESAPAAVDLRAVQRGSDAAFS